MQTIDFNKQDLARLFPDHIRDKCMRKFDEGRAETRAQKQAVAQDDSQDTDATYTTYRARHADAIREDGEQKAEWTYQRQH